MCYTCFEVGGEVMPMTIGSTVRALRTARGWSTTKLAELADMSQSYISEIENGKDPGRSALEKLSRAFGITVADLLAERPADSLAWFWRSRFASLRPSEIIEFRSRSVSDRVIWAIKNLTGAFPASDVAAKLDMSEDDLANLVAGRNAVSDWTVDIVSQKMDVPVNFLVNGDVGPIDELIRRLLTDDNCAAWLLLFDKARINNVPPEAVERLLDTALMLSKK
jgi:transcriptional regulator with XRE-family HTH domain